MGNPISMCLSNSKVKPRYTTKEPSTLYPQPGQHISIRTFRELRAAQMLSHTWKKTETSLILEFSRSMADQVEEVNNQSTILTRRR
ncbi:AC4 protein [Desmodium mosaic virus]|nr:AC4 protein [Desmodium mosaic virus]